MGEYRANVDTTDIILASVPTIGRRQDASVSERLQRFNPEFFKSIIIDEAHHSAAPSYRRVLEHFGAFHNDSHLLVWGCSATFRRNDNLGLGNLFQEITYHLNMSDLINQNWLSPAEVAQIYTDFNLDSVNYDAGNDDFSLDDLSLAVNTPQRNTMIAETWHKEAVISIKHAFILVLIFIEHGKRASIVFATNVAHAYGLAEAFNVFLPRQGDVSVVLGNMDGYERARILDEFSKGTRSVIINCNVLTEGTDLPITDCVLMARPTCNPSLYIQMAGRGLRKHPEKSYCLILDVVDKLKSPRRSLITFPSLNQGLQAHNINDNAELASTESLKKRKVLNEINYDSVVIKVKSSTEQVLSNINLENGAHDYAWASIPSYPIHVLDAMDFRIVLAEVHPTLETSRFTVFVTIKKAENDTDFDGFERVASHKLKKVLAENSSLDEALAQTSIFIEGQTSKSAAAYLRHKAFWRHQFPPSPRQVSMLFKIAKSCKLNCSVELDSIHRCKKGKAAAAITRWSYLKSIKCPVPREWHEIFY